AGGLRAGGFREGGVGQGPFVPARAARLGAPARPGRAPPELSRRGRTLAASALCREPPALRPFNAGVADTSEFPWRIWQRLTARAARELGPAALAFADPRGLPAPPSAIARHLAQLRAVRCRADHVVVFGRPQQALHALALLLVEPGDAVWLEDPAYSGARAALQLAGAAVASVPVDGEGLRVDLGVARSPRARLAYVTPPNQYPTGVALSPPRRIPLPHSAAP